jgi:GT2 family glycosyltransferase
VTTPPTGAQPPVPTVTAVVLAWQAEPWLPRCVAALLASEKVSVDVVLVDNGCTNDDVTDLDGQPGVTVLRPGHNLGFAGGCNAGAAAATGEYLALVNSDALVEPGALARLVQEAARPEVGVAVASIRLAEDPALLNAGANPIHVLGLSWSGGFGQREERTEPVDTAGASGACLLTRREHWRRLGGFDAEYFAYHEDAELSVRTWRLGLRVVYVPDAVVLHRYEFSRNTLKMYLVERNRLLFVATLWGWRSRLLLAPAFAGLEVAWLARAAVEGWLPAKLRGWAWLWTNRRYVRRRRALLRAEQRVPDRQWMRVLTPRMDTQVIALPAVVGPVNALLSAYWRLVSRWV